MGEYRERRNPAPPLWVGEGNFGLADGNASLAIESGAELELLCPCEIEEELESMACNRGQGIGLGRTLLDC